MKRFDLMHQINARGTFLCAKLALPHLKKSDNPHILTLSPPLDLEPALVLAQSRLYDGEIWHEPRHARPRARARGGQVAVNSLWPETAIATAAVGNLLGGEAVLRRARKPEIVADAAHAILTRDARACTGNFFVDVNVLKEEGVTDFVAYAVDPKRSTPYWISSSTRRSPRACRKSPSAA